MNYDILPPANYGSIWTTITVIAVIGVALYVLVLLLATRAKKVREKVVREVPVVYGEAARVKCMQDIDQLAADHAAGKYDASQVTQQLGVILRAFAADYSGLRTRPMTLAELKRAGVPGSLVAAIESFYPVAFGVMMEKESPAVALAHAKEIVYTWS